MVMYREKNILMKHWLTYPLVVLSPMCASNEDAQQYWRFANIIESPNNGNEESLEECSVTSPTTSNKQHFDNDEKASLPQSNDDIGTSCDEKPYLSAEESEPLEKENKCMETNLARDDLVHSHGRDFDTNTLNSENIEKLKYASLESSVHDICRKLETLERKVDTILTYLEKQTNTRTDIGKPDTLKPANPRVG